MTELDIDKDTARALLRDMIRIRRMEERCAELYTQQKIRGFLHLYIGEEAVATGIIPLLGAEDAVLGTYREHGHALVRGLSASSIMAEMFGKVTGCSRGRGGSMHLFSAENRFYGGHAIVGGGIPVAAGLAMGDRMQNRSNVTACFFGEGAVAEGEFHETMNLAVLWRLPVLFVCENNGYAMGTALERSESETSIRRKAEVYGAQAETVDGMDVLAVRKAAERAIAFIRERGEPYFLECKTYRFRAHSMFDPELYRDKAEVEEWKKLDPIATFFGRCKSAGLLDDADVEAIEADARNELDEAVAHADAAEWEAESELAYAVYAEEGTR